VQRQDLHLFVLPTKYLFAGRESAYPRARVLPQTRRGKPKWMDGMFLDETGSSTWWNQFLGDAQLRSEVQQVRVTSRRC